MHRFIKFGLGAMYYLFKLFGLATPSLRPSQPQVFQPSRLGLAYNLALYLGVLALNGRLILGLFYQNNDGQRKILDGLYQVLVVLNASVIAATFSLGHASFCSLLRRFVACRKLAATALDRVEVLTESRLPRKLLTNFSLLVGFMLASLILIIASCYDDDDIQTIRKLESSACSFANDYTIYAMLVQYDALLTCCLLTLRLLNDNLRELPRRRRRTDCTLTNKNSISYVRGRGDSDDQQFVLSRVRRYRQLHLGLTDLTDQLANFYSLPILSTLAFLLVSYIKRVFQALEPIVLSSGPVEPLGYLDNALTLAWHTVALVSITDTASKVEKESKRTGAEASDLMDTFDDQSTLYDKLSHFTTYNQFSQLQLRVFDFFPMNQTLLLSMLQTIATYVFINIQFVLSSEQQKPQQSIDDDIAAASNTTASSTLSLWSPSTTSTIIATTKTDD